MENSVTAIASYLSKSGTLSLTDKSLTFTPADGTTGVTIPTTDIQKASVGSSLTVRTSTSSYRFDFFSFAFYYVVMYWFSGLLGDVVTRGRGRRSQLSTWVKALRMLHIKTTDWTVRKLDRLFVLTLLLLVVLIVVFIGVLG